MKQLLGAFVALVTALLVAMFVAQGFSPALAQTQGAAPLPSFGEPGISPDGSSIAFASGGDIWEVPSRGGDARLLVSHPAADSRPMYSPDGSRLASTPPPTGSGGVCARTWSRGELPRLTFDDANERVNGWSADGKCVYFSSGS